MIVRFPSQLSLNTLKFALIVGSFVFVINHGTALVKGEMNLYRWFSATLGYTIPFVTGIYCPCAKRPSASQLTPKATLEI